MPGYIKVLAVVFMLTGIATFVVILGYAAHKWREAAVHETVERIKDGPTELQPKEPQVVEHPVAESRFRDKLYEFEYAVDGVQITKNALLSVTITQSASDHNVSALWTLETTYPRSYMSLVMLAHRNGKVTRHSFGFEPFGRERGKILHDSDPSLTDLTLATLLQSDKIEFELSDGVSVGEEGEFSQQHLKALHDLALKMPSHMRWNEKPKGK